jgi:hypothetical protein
MIVLSYEGSKGRRFAKELREHNIEDSGNSRRKTDG